MITMLSTLVVLLSGFINIPKFDKGRPHLRPPVIGRTVTAEKTEQRYSPIAKEASSPAKAPVISTAQADTKKSKHYKVRAFARYPDNYGYGNALGYAEESRYGPKGLFFR